MTWDITKHDDGRKQVEWPSARSLIHFIACHITLLRLLSPARVPLRAHEPVKLIEKHANQYREPVVLDHWLMVIFAT